MGKIERFEDLIAWQKARKLTSDIYRLTRIVPFASDFGLSNQIRRATVSIMSNIAEGFERWGGGEFQHFLSTAKASCAEVRCQLYIALDAGYLDQVTLHQVFSQAQEVALIIGGLRAAVEQQCKPSAKKSKS